MRFNPAFRGITLCFLVFWLGAFASPADGAQGWSWNLGYQNPANADFGVNFLYMGSRFGFELGIGRLHLDAEDDDNVNDSDDDDNSSLAIGGDVDLKYFFGGGSVRPFIQGGFLVGVGGQAGDDSGFGAGTGSGFGGLGIMADASSWYVYGSYNIGSWDYDFVQAGLGFDL